MLIREERLNRAPQGGDPRASVGEVRRQLARSFAAGATSEDPFRHLMLRDVLPLASLEALLKLPFALQSLGGVSGRRELHNESRHYFDRVAVATYRTARSIAHAFQADETVALIETATGAALDACYLRIEFAQDTEGFWLEPHTDVGVKMFTMLLYLYADGGDLGTDLYRSDAAWARRVPFRRNVALVFVPGSDTWHGFERRPFPGERKTLIVNYVTSGWRAREQLAFPDNPVSGR